MKHKLLISLFLLFVSAWAKGQKWDIQIPAYQVETARALAFNQVRDWGHSYLQAFEFTKSQGSGAYIFILDTGIKTDHPDLAANVDIRYAKDFTGSATGYQDANGHGTHCAGIAAAVNNDIGVVGIASQAKLVPVKVLNDSGSGSFSWVAQAIRYVADLPNDANLSGKKRIISMSLGGSSGSTDLYNAIKYAISKGVFLVAAAGNDYCNSPETVGYPGNYPEMITVASLDKSETVSAFSSCGKNVDVIAPGSGIYSTHLGNNYAYLSGTSMATPQVAGIAAILTVAYDIKTQSQLEAYLRKYAKDLGDKGFDTRAGYGASIATRYTALPDAPGDNPEPPTDTTPTTPTPINLKQRVLSVPVDGEFTILYGKASGGKFRFANIAGLVVEYTTTETVEVATARINKAVKEFYTNRGFVLPDNQYDTDFAAGWAEYFMKMILKQEGITIQTKFAWVSEILENGNRNLVYYDKQFPVSLSASQIRQEQKAGKLKTFTYTAQELVELRNK